MAMGDNYKVDIDILDQREFGGGLCSRHLWIEAGIDNEIEGI